MVDIEGEFMEKDWMNFVNCRLINFVWFYFNGCLFGIGGFDNCV